ncbi:TetR-like C-terminal domain-containing protein [Mycobacterium sp. 48b]|uniref:TetR-like C-terminal domain-containing protein n=1 Tax=Mycobacterium sp. 48b TaxID=3400426 RepID=UPI003AAFE237
MGVPDSAAKPRVRPGGRSEQVRVSVMRACLELLTEGKVELPIAEVADRSGINRGTIYRWWPTSTELLNDALAFHARHRTDAPDTGAWESDVRSLVTELASLAADPVERGIMATMISGRYPSLNDTMMGWYRNDLPHWFTMIGRAVERGEVSPDEDPAILLQMMLAPAVSVSLLERRALTHEEIDGLVTLICRATTSARS